MCDDDVVGVRRYTPGDPVAGNEIPTQAAFSKLDAVRVELVPLSEKLERAVYIVFRGLGDGPEDPQFKEVREATGARTNNLWYRIVEGGNMAMEENVAAVRMLEMTLQVMEDATTTH